MSLNWLQTSFALFCVQTPDNSKLECGFLSELLQIPGWDGGTLKKQRIDPSVVDGIVLLLLVAMW